MASSSSVAVITEEAFTGQEPDLLQSKFDFIPSPQQCAVIAHRLLSSTDATVVTAFFGTNPSLGKPLLPFLVPKPAPAPLAAATPSSSSLPSSSPSPAAAAAIPAPAPLSKPTSKAVSKPSHTLEGNYRLPKSVKIYYIRNAEELQAACTELFASPAADASSSSSSPSATPTLPKYIGFNCEAKQKGNVQMVQLATQDWAMIWHYPCPYRNQIPEVLTKLLTDPKIHKFGPSIHTDISKVSRDLLIDMKGGKCLFKLRDYVGLDGSHSYEDLVTSLFPEDIPVKFKADAKFGRALRDDGVTLSADAQEYAAIMPFINLKMAMMAHEKYVQNKKAKKAITVDDFLDNFDSGKGRIANQSSKRRRTSYYGGYGSRFDRFDMSSAMYAGQSMHWDKEDRDYSTFGSYESMFW